MATALHDYRCPSCGYVLRDVAVSMSVGAQAGAPYCPTCSVSSSFQPDEVCMVRMEWIPQTCAMDIGGVKTAAFQAIDVFDNLNRPVRVDSLHKLRQVERDSERMAADGIGSPMVWRDFSQDRSNRHTHTLAKLDADHMSDPHGVRDAIQRGKTKFPKAVGDAVTAEHGTIPVED